MAYSIRTIGIGESMSENDRKNRRVKCLMALAALVGESKASTLLPVDHVEGEREGRVNSRLPCRARQGPAKVTSAAGTVTRGQRVGM